MSADAVRDRFADRDIGSKAKERALQSIIPGDLAAGVQQPGLVNNEDSFSQEQGWNQTSQTDIVLKK